MLNIGIIGCGKIAQVRHLPEYEQNPGARIAGLYDLNQERAQTLAAQYGAKVYPSYEALLADPAIDAVSVCSANVSHAEITVAALEAGKHVLCEKPMATTLEDCERMVAAARPRVLQEGDVVEDGRDDRTVKPEPWVGALQLCLFRGESLDRAMRVLHKLADEHLLVAGIVLGLRRLLDVGLPPGEPLLHLAIQKLRRQDDAQFLLGAGSGHVNEPAPLRPGPLPVTVLHGQQIHRVELLALGPMDGQRVHLLEVARLELLTLAHLELHCAFRHDVLEQPLHEGLQQVYLPLERRQDADGLPALGQTAQMRRLLLAQNGQLLAVHAGRARLLVRILLGRRTRGPRPLAVVALVPADPDGARRVTVSHRRFHRQLVAVDRLVAEADDGRMAAVVLGQHRTKLGIAVAEHLVA